MKSKQLIRFYFSASRINQALDNLILYSALKQTDYIRGGEYCAERVCKIIEDKSHLGNLWGYLDGVISSFTVRERAVLKFYAKLRVGLKRLPRQSAKEVKRVVVKFTRHARSVYSYGEGLARLSKYYCLMHAG